MNIDNKPGLIAETEMLGKMDLDADQAARLNKCSETLILMGHTLQRSMKASGGEAPKLDLDLVHALLGSAEHNLAAISEVSGVSSETQAEIEHRYAQIRYANQRVHELEAQIGAETSMDAVKQALGVLKRKLNYWWDEKGFGYIPEIRFDEHGVHVTLSCSLHGTFRRSFSKTPASDADNHKSWLKSLEMRGFTLSDETRFGNDPQILDTPEARKIIRDILVDALPSSKISDLKSQTNRRDEFVLREFSIYVHDYSDIERLKTPPVK